MHECENAIMHECEKRMMECVITGIYEWKNEKKFPIIICALCAYVVTN
jgi:hypothetical protein